MSVEGSSLENRLLAFLPGKNWVREPPAELTAHRLPGCPFVITVLSMSAVEMLCISSHRALVQVYARTHGLSHSYNTIKNVLAEAGICFYFWSVD